MYIKSSCKALIVNRDKILLNRCLMPNGDIYYALPGGGQNRGEGMEKAVIRECREETGYNVRVIRMAAMGERISNGQHKLYHIFLCELDGNRLAAPTNTDSHQIGYEWVDPSAKIPLFPRFIRENLTEMLEQDHVVYLGSEHDGRPVADHGKITLRYLQEYLRAKDLRPREKESCLLKLMDEMGTMSRLILRGAHKATDDRLRGSAEEQLCVLLCQLVNLANILGADLEHWLPIKESQNNRRYYPGLKFDPEEWILKK